jgi:chitosanase
LNAGEGDCFNDPTGQSQTAFKDSVQEFGIDDLDSHIHTFVVLGNDNSADEGDGGKSFDPQSVGIKPLSVVAVVCGDNLFYGVWGDVNGGKVTGESSLSLGQLCFPNEDINGNAGHGDHDVLYIAFAGDEAVPGADAAWTAETREEFEESLATVGDKLVAGLGGAASNSRIMRGKV